jgi:hypothetical protein
MAGCLAIGLQDFGLSRFAREGMAEHMRGNLNVLLLWTFRIHLASNAWMDETAIKVRGR